MTRSRRATMRWRRSLLSAASPPSAPAIKRAVRVISGRGTIDERKALRRLQQRLFRRPAHDSSEPSPAVDRDPTVAGSIAPMHHAPQFGRYHVLATAGVGGMGQVLRCYDPQLDREVAIKRLTRRSIPQADQRLVREAQAMARLSHPNVLSVYDVAQEGDEWFIVMEYVEGRTFAQWLDTRPPSDEVLAAFIFAAEGLAAAHRAGIVHRDFKPANVLVGRDGRVRVMDFGLASAGEPSPDVLDEPFDVDAKTPLTRAGTVVGTPAYMAPEQHEGQPATPRSDQYSFCLALWEGVHGERPFRTASLHDLLAEKLTGAPAVPRTSLAEHWLDPILRRGLAPEPAGRYATMDELIAVLSRPRRRRAVLWLACLGALASITVAALASQARAQPICVGAGEKLAGIWDEERAEAAHAAFVRTGAAFAEEAWQRTRQTLDAYADAWVAAHTEACEATHLRGDQSPAVLDARIACLARRLGALDTLTRTLAEADESIVERAPVAARSLESVEACADIDALTSGVPVPIDDDDARHVERLRTQLEEATVLHDAGRFDAAEPVASRVLDEARDLAYEPLLAEALLVSAKFRRWRVRADDAEVLSAEATLLASRIGHDEVAMDAVIEWVRAVGHGQARYDDAQQLARWADALAGRTRDPVARRREVVALEGLLALEHGRLETAESSLRGLLDELHRDPQGEDGPLANAEHNLGIIYMRRGEYARARPLLEHVLERAEQIHGPNHPAIAATLVALGGVCHGEGDIVCAREHFERALRVREPVLGRDAPASWDAIVNLGVLAMEAGDHDEATAHFERALALRAHVLGESHPDLVFPLTGLGVVELRRGRLDEAERRLSRAVTIVFENGAIGRSEAVDALTSLCDVYGAQDRWADVAELSQRGLDALTGTSEPIPRSVGFLQAHRGRAALNLGEPALAVSMLDAAVRIDAVPTEFHFTLARALDAVGREPERALELAREALAASSGDASRVAMIESFIRERTPNRSTGPR